jgi:hypothetical protein
MPEFTIGGRRVTEQAFMRNLRESAHDAAIDSVQEHLRRVRCPKHGQTPRVKPTGARGSSPKFEIEACCDALMKRATAAVGAG